MRIRGVLAAGAAALLLAGCGGQSGPGGEQASTEAPRAEGLRVELDAQTQDPCFREPAELAPADCQKYITQLTSTPESAEKITRSGAGLQKAAQQLREGISGYRDRGCASVTSANAECTQALRTVADALRAMRQALEPGAG